MSTVYLFYLSFYAKADALMIVVSVFLKVHNPSAWKLKKFTSFWHLNVGMILIRQCVQTMLLLIIDFTPPLYYVLHLFFGGDTYDLVASFSSSCQCWFYWHGSRPQHRSALLVGRWFFFSTKDIEVCKVSTDPNWNVGNKLRVVSFTF